MNTVHTCDDNVVSVDDIDDGDDDGQCWTVDAEKDKQGQGWWLRPILLQSGWQTQCRQLPTLYTDANTLYTAGNTVYKCTLYTANTL